MTGSRSISRLALVSASLLLAAAGAHAHHSGAMFDNSKSDQLSGTVKAFQWTNPHCWIQLLVPADPAPVEWSIEMGSPSLLFRGGWKPKSLQPGDKISVVIHPMRDGTHGGLYVSATLADGKSIGSRP